MSSVADYWFLLPILALLAGLLTLAPLGVQVLRRGVVFIDLAVAQAAAAAALLSHFALHHATWWQTQFAAALGALGCVAAVAYSAKRWPEQREALIGLMYVGFAGLAMLIARADHHGDERLLALLAADVLWADWPQLVSLLTLTVLLSACRRFYPAQWQTDRCFYPLFAISASIAVAALGLFLVFVLLIAPALWLRLQLPYWLVCTLASLLAAAGLSLSWCFDLPSGVCLALLFAGWGLSAMFKSRPAD